MIQLLKVNEAEEICQIHFQEALKESGLKSFSFSKEACVKALCSSKMGKGGCITAIMVYREIAAGIIEVDFIASHSSYKRSGGPSQLLASLGASEVWLELMESNYKAKSFYKKHNFKEVGRRACYYPDGQAAINMCRVSS